MKPWTVAMSDHTPITDQDVEDAWVLAQEHHNDNGDLHERKTFRRWLAAHDAEVRADEREKAAQRVQKEVREQAEEDGRANFSATDLRIIAAARGEGESNG